MTTEPTLRITFRAPKGESPGEMARLLAQPSERVRAGVELGLQKLAMVAQKERFTGQGPFPVARNKLGVRTGRLRRDIHAEPVTRTAKGYRGRIGSVVEYFGSHERGFDGTVQVKAHRRREYTVRSGRYSVLAQSVRAHSKHLQIPARAPLATAIKQHSEAIFSKSIRAAIKP